tara:strand:- start:494 stop:865 length:372 start_codon:yes stop_codon:yes gene_type:complete
MYLKNEDKIAEISHLIPHSLNLYGVSADQNEKVLKKIYGLQLRKMRLMRGYTQTRVAKAISVTFQQIQKYEKGVNAVSIMNELKLAEFLKCDRNYFVKPLIDNGHKFLNKNITWKVREHDNQD